METGLLIKVDGTETKVLPADGKEFSLAELQGFVGGYIERVGFPDGRTLYVHEEGKLLNFEVNKKATEIWRTIFAGYDFGADDFVVGDVLIVTN